MLSETLCDNQLSWLEDHLSSRDNLEELRRSWHRVYGDKSRKSGDIVRKLRDEYGCMVITFLGQGNSPHIEVRVNGPGKHHLEFDGLHQIEKYLSTLYKFL